MIIRGGEAAVGLACHNNLELARGSCNVPLPCFTGIGHECDSTILDEVAHRKFDTLSKVALHNGRTIGDNALAALAHFERVPDLTSRSLATRHLMIDDGRDRVAGLVERALERFQRAVAYASTQNVEHTAATVQAWSQGLIRVTG